MNSKLLYTHFRHEGKHNGKIKLETHSHKKGKYRLQHEITHEFMKDTSFQLYNLKKYLNTQISKSHEFQPLLHQKYEYLYIAP